MNGQSVQPPETRRSHKEESNKAFLRIFSILARQREDSRQQMERLDQRLHHLTQASMRLKQRLCQQETPVSLTLPVNHRLVIIIIIKLFL